MTIPFSENIDTVEVDFSFKDPNIRGASGSIMAAASEEELEEFTLNMKNGMSRRDAEQNLAVKIARNAQRVIGATQEQL